MFYVGALLGMAIYAAASALWRLWYGNQNTQEAEEVTKPINPFVEEPPQIHEQVYSVVELKAETQCDMEIYWKSEEDRAKVSHDLNDAIFKQVEDFIVLERETYEPDMEYRFRANLMVLQMWEM